MTRRALWALVAVLALIAAACSPADEAADTTEAPATTEAPEATTTTEEMMTTTTSGVPADWPEKIIFGFVPSQEQEELSDDIQPFVDILTEALGIEVEGIVTTDYTGLVTAMGTGQADFGAFGPIGYVLAEREFDLEVLIQSIRRGAATYHGQWFTNDPSLCDTDPAPGAYENEPIGDPDAVPVLHTDPTEVLAQQVGYDYSGDEPVREEGISEGHACEGVEFEDLAGKTVAFTTETSTSGYVFPALQLINAGVDPETEITPIFTGGHDGAVTAVYNGDADVGVSFDDARGTIDDTNPDVGEKVIVFNLTSEIPNDVVAVRAELPDSLKNAVFDAISAYLETDEGKAVFDEIYEWTDIRRANDADFDVVRDAAEKLGITEP